MYPASLHKIPTQNVDSPKVGQMYTPEATAKNQEYYKKLGQNHN